MEGERIMKSVLNGTFNKNLPSDIKGYVRPLLTGKTTQEVSSKYQPYAMKLLKAIIQTLSTSLQEETSHFSLLIKSAQVCIDALVTSDKHCPFHLAKIKSYTFEKLLLNLVNTASKMNSMNTVMSCYEIMYDRLSVAEMNTETESLVNSLADVMLRAGNIMIEKSQPSSDKILLLQGKAIKVLFLLSSQFQRALRLALFVDNQLIKRCGNNDQTWSLLVSFHESLLDNKNYKKRLVECQDCQIFLSVFELLLTINRTYIKLDHRNSQMFINRIQKITQHHYKNCSNNCSPIYDLLITLHKLIPSLPTQQLSQISHIDLSSLSSSHLFLLADNIEFTLMKINTSTITKAELDWSLLSPLKDLFIFYDKCLDAYSKSSQLSSNIITSIKCRHLTGVNLLVEILVNLLMGSSSTDNITETCCSLTFDFLPLIKKSGHGINSIPSLPIGEYYSFGVSAFNMGQILGKMNCLEEACPVLQLACEQFLIYCQKSNDTWEEIMKLKLYNKFAHLIETLLKVGKVDVAMETLELMMSSLWSTNQTLVRDQLVACISQFVHIKCIGRTLIDPSHLLLTRNSCDWLTSCHDNSFKLSCLQEELKAYQVLQQDTRAWQFSVAKQLVSIYPKGSHEYCWILIKLASLNMTTSFSSCNDLLSQAISILKSMKDNNCMTFDLLGLAYFWKGLCLHVLGRDTTNCEERVIDSLTNAVDYWCMINSKKEKKLTSESFIDYPSTLHHLLLCASFTNTLLLSNLSQKILEFLLLLSQSVSSKDSSVLFYQALAMKTKLLLSFYGVEFISNTMMSQLEKAGEMAIDVCEKDEKMYASYLMCKLQLSHVYILKGEVNKGHNILKEVLSHPIMQSSKCDLQYLLASCTVVTSLYLECLWKPPSTNNDNNWSGDINEMLSSLDDKSPCNISLCPCNEIINDSNHSDSNHSDSNHSDNKTKPFFLTNLELALDNIKLTRSLIYNLISTSSNESLSLSLKSGDDGENLVAMGTIPIYKTWEITALHMESILRLSRAYLVHGMIRESEHYGEEGIELAKKLHLVLWHATFLIHMAKIKMIMGDNKLTHEHLTEANTVLGLKPPTTTTTTTTTTTNTSDSDDSIDISMAKLSLNDSSNNTTTSAKRPPSATYSLLTLAFSVTKCQYYLMIGKNDKCLTEVSHIMTLLKDTKVNEISLPYLIECLTLKTRALIATNKLTDIQFIANNKLISSGHSLSHLPSLRLALATLYYHLSIGTLLKIEDSPIIDKLCSNGVSGKLGTNIPTNTCTTKTTNTCTTNTKIKTTTARTTSIKVNQRSTRKTARSINDKEEKEEEIPKNEEVFKRSTRTRAARRINDGEEEDNESVPQRSTRRRRTKRISDEEEEKEEEIKNEKVSKRNTRTRRTMRISDEEENDKVHQRTTRKPRARRISDEEGQEKEEIPSELQPSLFLLLKGSQYITPPTLSTCLYRDVYSLLGFCLTGVRTDLASHFLLLSSSVSLNQQSVFWFGKKLRKQNGLRSSKTILNEILSNMTTPPTSLASSPLVHARLKLHPLPHPPTLLYTRTLVNGLPDKWVYCSLSMIEVFRNRKVLLILRVQSKKDDILVRIPFNKQIASVPATTCSLNNSQGQTECELLTEFNHLMTASNESTKLTDKKEWWRIRKGLDKQLLELLIKFESSWLGHWRILLLSTLPSLSSSSFSTLSSLLTKCGISTVWVELLVGGAQFLTSRELQAVLHSFITDTTGSVTIAEITSAIRNAKSSPGPPQPLILSLSQSLQEIPLENIPLLCDQLVTRIPSLQFLLAHLLLQGRANRRHGDGLDPTHTYYVVNPSGDLKNTQKTFEDWFEREEGWNGVIGRPPSSNEFVNGLKNHDTFIYLGHGKAREYLGKEQRLQELDTNATVLQMGCSSGKLETIGSLDPQGMALNFLISGCPFLVANLWDVTDIDIDRFCTSLVKNWLTEPPNSETTKEKEDKTRTHIELLCNLTEARDSCRLRYLIGASPVVYGLPVH